MLKKGYKYEKLSSVKLAQILEAGKVGREVNAALAVKRRLCYNEFPNHCLNCEAPILVPDDASVGRFSEIKKKKFCNQSCGAKYHNRVLGYPHRKPKVRMCSLCGAEYISPYRTTFQCFDCRQLPHVSILASRTKGESLVQEIRNHARTVLFGDKERKCEVCGYSIRVDCCHVKPIKAFPKDALLSEINSLENLKALCPNHHVELDLGIRVYSGL